MNHSSETVRLEALISLAVLDTAPERAYDDITRMAAMLCGTPIALISLIDAKRQWFKSGAGLDVQETPSELAFCAHAIQRPQEVMVVHHAAADERFKGNALVIGEPMIRFYAGAPILIKEGHAMGTVCVIDRMPRTLPDLPGASFAIPNCGGRQDAARTETLSAKNRPPWRPGGGFRHAPLPPIRCATR